MKFCVKCGAEFPEGEVAFCAECGAAVAVPQTPTATKRPSSSGSAATGQATKRTAEAPEQTTPFPKTPPVPEPPLPAYREFGPGPARRSPAALWVAWTVVFLLAAGNIVQGLYFGVFRDHRQEITVTSDALPADLGIVVALDTNDTTVATDSAPDSSTEDTYDATAKALLRNAQMVIESARIDLGTYDPTVLTPEVLASIEPSIIFMPDYEGVDIVAAAAQDSTVQYAGTDELYAIGTVSASGRVFVVVYDQAFGHQTYVDGEPVEW